MHPSSLRPCACPRAAPHKQLTDPVRTQSFFPFFGVGVETPTPSATAFFNAWSFRLMSGELQFGDATLGSVLLPRSACRVAGGSRVDAAAFSAGAVVWTPAKGSSTVYFSLSVCACFLFFILFFVRGLLKISPVFVSLVAF